MSDAIVRLAAILAEAGVDQAFGVSGSGPSYRLISALKERGAAYVPVSHEAVAPVAAGAYTWLTGKRAAAISIKGPGLANMLAGMSSAYLEGYAPICIAENYDDSVPVERMHKRLDQPALTSSLVEAAYSLNDLAVLPEALAKAKGATRPFYIEMANSTTRAAGRSDAGADAVNDADWRGALARVASAERVLLVVGSIARRRGWQPRLEALGIPILTTTQAKGAIDERKPNAAGIYTGVGKSLAVETQLVPAADLVVTLGARNMEILGVAGKRGFVNLDLPHHLSTSDDLIVDDAAIDAVFAALAEKKPWGEDIIADNRVRWREYVDSFAWMPGQVFAALDALPAAHSMVLDTGTFCTIGEHVWRAIGGRDFVGSSNGRNLGLGVPHALAASTARPGTPVFCALGDGGIRYYLADLRSIAALARPVCFVLMHDGRYGSIACNVPKGPPDDGILAPLGTSWADVMNAMGIPAGVATDAASFQGLLGRWSGSGPYFIEARFDPEAYLAVANEIRA